MFVLLSRTSVHKFGKCIFNQYCKLTCIVRRIQVFLDVALYHWVSGSQCFEEHLCLQHSAHYCDDTPTVQQAVRHTIVTLQHHPVSCLSQYCDGIITVQLAVYHNIDDITTVQLAGNHIKMIYLLTSQLYIRILSLSLGKRQAK